MWGLFFLLVLLIPLLAVILDSQLGRALARRIEGKGLPDNARVSRLEAEVERLNRELERLQEQSDFVTRLLEEPGRRALPGGREASADDGVEGDPGGDAASRRGTDPPPPEEDRA